MAEKLNLNRFKSSGVYTVEIDESQNISLPISTGRLVIGSSKKGPINSVVLVNDTRTANAVYGEIDTKLEKNGSYFHRTIDVALRQGPVYALNILPVSNDPETGDMAYFRTFNSESASNNSSWSTNTNVSLMSNFYNTQKLWFADSDQVNKYKNIELGDDYILAPGTYGNADRDANKILTLVNLSRKDITAWVRVADTTGYDITVKEYYKLLGQKVEVPEYLNDDDIVADYFVEIVAVEGNWTDYLKLAKDPVYRQYFTEAGIIDAKINDFIALREVNLVTKTSGAIIPDFRDLTDAIVSIDTVLNRKFAQTGLFCAIDNKKIDLIDLTQDSFNSGSSTESMATQRIDLVGHGIDELDTYEYFVDNGNDTTDPVGLIDLLSYKKPMDSTFYFTIDDLTAPTVFGSGEIYLDENYDYDADYSNIYATEGSTLYNAWKNGFIKTGHILEYLAGEGGSSGTSGVSPATTTYRYLATDGQTLVQNGVKYVVFTTYSDITRTNQTDAKMYGASAQYLKIYIPAYTAGGTEITNYTDVYKQSFDLSEPSMFINYSYTSPNKLEFEVYPSLYGNAAKGESTAANTAADSAWAYDQDQRNQVDAFFKVGQYIKANIETEGTVTPIRRPRMLRIKSVYAQKITKTNFENSGSSATTLKYTITTDSPSDVNTLGIYFDGTTVTLYKGIKNYIKTLVGGLVPAMSLNDSDLYPNGTASRQDAILDFMFDSSNLAQTLADNETVDFRYIIDSFEGQIAPASKQQLVQLAADHGKALAIVNAPSFAQYERSVSPSFIDLTTRLVSAEAISTGGDLTSNPEFVMGFAAGEKNGIPISSYAAYFMPNLIIFENGRNKSIPPAMYVANAFIKKYTSGNTFSIVGGKRGILSEPELSGLEYDLTNEDRDYLEPAGFNLIVRRRGFGIMVFSNNTAYQRVKSALNNIHVREALITIERDIERILLNFLFDFNDVTTRMRVKTLVKNYLAAVQDARGIISADVIMDDSNNTVEVLENNAGIVDIIVNFPRGIHKFINRITITRANGQLSSTSTGFTPSF